MTYRELGHKINLMSSEQRNMTVTVFVPDIEEFYPVDNISYSVEEQQDVLDGNHPILNIRNEE